MEVEFKSKKLRSAYESSENAVRLWGAEVARRYVNRVNILYACRAKEDLHQIPQLRLHALKGKQKGRFAIDLTGMVRLIVSFASGSRDVVRIQEVSKHYGD